MNQTSAREIADKLRQPSVIAEACQVEEDSFVRALGERFAKSFDGRDDVTAMDYVLAWELLLADMRKGQAGPELSSYPPIVVMSLKMAEQAIASAVCPPEFADAVKTVMDQIAERGSR